MADAKRIAHELVLFLEKDNANSPYIYFRPDVEECGAEIDGHIDFLEVVQFVLDKASAS